eukprot:CAMPEP_0175051164 /NCGR_PEP_ID=MMETSP0052_2-20121109/7644_2 /TAXON_ID=51329 ORGANISM="Polytomella parva, Strain SAG 63-3" /NCGR_SAMPLE_ID=MMETSP0052_2 /ASSEMBLY_ACC=CAM_ASM_000194 /LENGTH=47 /DNA_ID= /DNA_START= /DNA_END= /DNA_ORIENTATION=
MAKLPAMQGIEEEMRPLLPHAQPEQEAVDACVAKPFTELIVKALEAL